MPLWLGFAIVGFATLALRLFGKVYTFYKLRTDANFHKQWEAIKERERKHQEEAKRNEGKSGLQIRLEEMQRKAEDMKRKQSDRR